MTSKTGREAARWETLSSYPLKMAGLMNIRNTGNVTLLLGFPTTITMIRLDAKGRRPPFGKTAMPGKYDVKGRAEARLFSSPVSKGKMGTVFGKLLSVIGCGINVLSMSVTIIYFTYFIGSRRNPRGKGRAVLDRRIDCAVEYFHVTRRRVVARTSGWHHERAGAEPGCRDKTADCTDERALCGEAIRGGGAHRLVDHRAEQGRVARDLQPTRRPSAAPRQL